MLSRSWITGLALAGVAGSAGAAFAGMSEGAGPFASASELPSTTATVEATTTSAVATARTISYQVGAAGTVTVTVADGALAVTGSSAGAGWTVVGAGAPGAHVEVQFTDTMQLVTFTADLVGDDVVVALASVPAPGATTVPMARHHHRHAGWLQRDPDPAARQPGDRAVFGVPDAHHAEAADDHRTVEWRR